MSRAAIEAVTRWVLAQGAPERLCLYDGAAGVVLFLLEAADRLGHEDARRVALACCHAMAGGLDGLDDDGLYSGRAGVAFALAEAARRTGSDDLAGGAAKAAAGLGQWTAVADVVSGTAGVGLFLLWAARHMDWPEALERAVDGGEVLLAAGVDGPGGTAWAKHPGVEVVLPNFSHGTAGVAYFLASLAVDTGDDRFLAAALSGAGHLLALADGGGLVPRSHGSALRYLGWCHGPAGTGRLFYKLWQATGEGVWLERLDRTGRSLLAADVAACEGVWNNRGQCCGHAGIGEYALALHRVTGDAAYAGLADDMAAAVLDAAVEVDGGVAWPDAVHRAAPDDVAMLPGYMQGAAGIGAFLLHHESAADAIVFPDSPFGR